MSADIWVFRVAWTLGIFALGFETALWALPPKPPAVRARPPITSAQLLTCPVTASTIAEYHRSCKARFRTTAVQPMETP